MQCDFQSRSISRHSLGVRVRVGGGRVPVVEFVRMHHACDRYLGDLDVDVNLCRSTGSAGR